MTSLADKAIFSGADNRPPMLEKDMYDSWKSIMELYMLNRQHDMMILESLKPFKLIVTLRQKNHSSRTSSGGFCISQYSQGSQRIVGKDSDANARHNRPAFYNNDEDDDEDYTIAITPDFLITDSLSMGDKYLSIIPETESDELIKSSVENLVPNLSEFKDLSDIESECDVPVCDDFTAFSNLLFDADEKFSSSDGESFSDENVPKEIYSNPLFDEEIISIKIDPHHINVDFDLIESFRNQGSSITSSPKFDSLLEEFSGELTHIDLIPPGINEADLDPEEEIHLAKKLLYDN
nr:hypothetical protein [Tanacetum cinerariifolium]